MQRAAAEHPGAILAVGNAPTALLTIADLIETAGLRPALVIGVPVGFVNVVESKERLFEVCTAHGVPAIVAMGRKGGSNVAAAICNALVYSAAGMLDPRPGMEIIFLLFAFKVLCGALLNAFSANSPLEGILSLAGMVYSA